MQIDVIRYEPHTLSLRPLKFFFQQLHRFLQLQSCFIRWYEKEQSIKLQPLCIHNGHCFETLNLLHISSCKMFVMSYIKQNKNTNTLPRVRSTDWKSSLTMTYTLTVLKCLMFNLKIRLQSLESLWKVRWVLEKNGDSLLECPHCERSETKLKENEKMPVFSKNINFCTLRSIILEF